MKINQKKLLVTQTETLLNKTDIIVTHLFGRRYISVANMCRALEVDYVAESNRLKNSNLDARTLATDQGSMLMINYSDIEQWIANIIHDSVSGTTMKL